MFLAALAAKLTNLSSRIEAVIGNERQLAILDVASRSQGQSKSDGFSEQHASVGGLCKQIK